MLVIGILIFMLRPQRALRAAQEQRPERIGGSQEIERVRKGVMNQNGVD